MQERTTLQFRGTSNSLTFTLDFGNTVLGGAFKIDATVPYKQPSGATGNLTVNGTSSIKGDNPSKADIKTLLETTQLCVICYKESRFRQFDASNMPLFGPPAGFGVMQLDTPAPSARQIWEWKDNIAAGKALYATKLREVKQHFRNIRTAHPEAPELTEEQLKLALYQYYNGGFYCDWDTVARTWKKIDTTGYGDDSLRIEKLVDAGTPPSDWN